MQIAALDNDTIKLINTAQVITSVSTAVKELLENAFDANAKSIDITLLNAGSSLIQVKDDGTGISKENAQFMALSSYTSKISYFSDLDTLQTYGFRGEALAALCAVADVVITTKPDQEDVATTYVLDHSGRISNSFSCHRSRGTTIQVKDLFKRIPVRRQLITNPKKGLQEIKVLESLLKSYAICRFYARINFRVDNSTIFSKLSSNSLKESIGHIFGKKATDSMTWLEFENTEVSMQLMVPSRNTIEISDVLNSYGRYIFVNDRPIQHKQLDMLMTKTIFEGLSQEINSRKKPMYVLRLLIDPADIDVNVEPNKTTIFFKNQDCILDKIEAELRVLYGLESEELRSNNVLNASNTYLDNTIAKDLVPLEGLPCKKRKLDTEHNTNENTIARDGEANGESREIPIIRDLYISNSVPGSVENPLTSHCLNSSRADSEEDVHLGLSAGSKNSSVCTTKKFRENRSHSPLFQLSQNIPSDVPETQSESLSQLPVVDLGDDFDMALYDQECCDGTGENLTLETIKDNSVAKRITLSATSEKATLESWSKGHVDGLKGGTSIESYVESYVQASQEGNAFNASEMQNLLPCNKSCTGLLKFLKQVAPQIGRENPGLSIAQTVQKIIDRWKSLPVEERGYYRDIAKPLIKKESKAELSPVVLQRNKEKLLNMFEKMKTLNTEMKENLVMRTNVSWIIDMNKIRQNTKANHDNRILVGKLRPNLCVVKHSANLWALEIANLGKGLKVSGDPIDEIDNESLERALSDFVIGKNDFSALHAICHLEED